MPTAAVGMLMAGGGLMAWRLGSDKKPVEHADAQSVQLRQD